MKLTESGSRGYKPVETGWTRRAPVAALDAAGYDRVLLWSFEAAGVEGDLGAAGERDRLPSLRPRDPRVPPLPPFSWWPSAGPRSIQVRVKSTPN